MQLDYIHGAITRGCVSKNVKRQIFNTRKFSWVEIYPIYSDTVHRTIAYLVNRLITSTGATKTLTPSLFPSQSSPLPSFCSNKSSGTNRGGVALFSSSSTNLGDPMNISSGTLISTGSSTGGGTWALIGKSSLFFCGVGWGVEIAVGGSSNALGMIPGSALLMIALGWQWSEMNWTFVYKLKPLFVILACMEYTILSIHRAGVSSFQKKNGNIKTRLLELLPKQNVHQNPKPKVANFEDKLNCYMCTVHIICCKTAV